MLDFVLGAVLVALLVRGWLRGFAREAIGLAVVVVGAFLAFRLSGPAGSIISAMAGTPSDASRFIGGIAVFVLISTGAAVISFVVHRGIRILPGLTTANRLAGAAFAFLAGLFLATLVVTVAAVSPLPGQARKQLGDSVIAARLVDPDGAAQTALGALSGDRILTTVLQLQETLGVRHVVATETPIVIPAAPPDDLRAAGNAADKLYDLVNTSRVDFGSDPLSRSETLDGVAREAAVNAYESGFLGDPIPIERRLEVAGIPVVTAAEVTGLGASVGSVHEGMLANASAGEQLIDIEARRMGVSAVRGPYGLVAVVVLAG